MACLWVVVCSTMQLYIPLHLLLHHTMYNFLHHRWGQRSILFVVAFAVVGFLFVTTIFQKDDAVVERSQQPFAPDI